MASAGFQDVPMKRARFPKWLFAGVVAAGLNSPGFSYRFPDVLLVTFHLLYLLIFSEFLLLFPQLCFFFYFARRTRHFAFSLDVFSSLKDHVFLCVNLFYKNKKKRSFNNRNEFYLTDF